MITRALSALAAVVLCAAGAQAQETIRIGTEGAYPPWNFTNPDGTLGGFEIDLGNALCAEMGVTCEFVAQDWDGIIPALLSGRYDAIMAGMSATEERKQTIAFSDSYVADPAYFIATKDSELQAAETVDQVKEALAGKIVAAQVSTIHQYFIEQELGSTVELRTYDTQENMQLDLIAGRIDAALADYAAWRTFMETADGANFDVFGPGLSGQEFPVFGEGVAVGLRKEDTELLERFNTAFAALKANGTLTRLSEQYFGYDMTVF